MRRAVVILILGLALAAVSLYIARTYLFWDGISATRIAQLVLPRKDVKQYLPQGSDLAYPFKIPYGYKLDVFASFRGGFPRVLALDPKGRVVTTLSNRGEVVVLPDEDRDGKADEQIVIMRRLNRPHGIAFDGNFIYIAETDKVIKARYNEETLEVGPAEVLFTLPGGGKNWSRTIRIHDGKLYTGVGSSCDACLESDPERAAILVSELDGSGLEVFAEGLRNTAFFAFDSRGRLWGNDVGRDSLGDNLPPDELNLIAEGKNYGWPYCYGQRVRDIKFAQGEKMTFCVETESPKFDYPANVDSLGITFINSRIFSAGEQGNLLVAFHGSESSRSPNGFKIVKLEVFAEGVAGMQDFISGFLLGKEILGRPVDLLFDREGRLFISDDYAGLIYILTGN